MKTIFLVGRLWKKHFGNVTCLQYHVTSVINCGNKQMYSNFSKTALMDNAPAFKNKHCNITLPNTACKWKTIIETQISNTVQGHSRYLTTDKHVHMNQKLQSNPCSQKMPSEYEKADLVGCRGFATHGKDQQKSLSQTSSSCLSSNISNPSNSLHTDLDASRFFCSSVTDSEYKPCYVFKYIVHTRVLSRLKIYQTLATIMAIPPAVYLHNVGKLSTVDMYAMFGITSVACVMLYVMSLYFRRIVGMISVCQETGMVRLSHLTFWGKRKDVYLSPQDIVPMMDMSESAKRVYALVKTYNSNDTFLLFLKFHRIFDKEQLERIFGPLV